MSPAPSSRAPLIGAIWAQTAQGVIGAQGTMPWHVPEDLAHFKRVTDGHPVIMGRRTWDSFPEKFRPLPGRTNIVLTTNQAAREQISKAGAVPVTSIEQAFEAAGAAEGSNEIWIIGGANLFEQTMDRVDTAIITQLDLSVPGDTRAPQLPAGFSRMLADPAEGWHTSKTGTGYRFESWQNNEGRG